MTNVKVVVGANWGDEGKGLITDYFCHQATSKGENCIVVLSNGGAQRGHTVLTPEGLRHVFHHFGSGTFVGADTYFCDKYILNPMTFRKEYEELLELGCNPKVFSHYNCMWSTPYDMMINQMAEDSRGNARHGSCGMGIWETIVRYYSTQEPYSLTNFNNMPFLQKAAYLRAIKDVYAKMRLRELDITIPYEWEDIFSSTRLIDNFIDDVNFMCEHITWTDDSVLASYDNIVFENGQGLLLDQNNIAYGDNTTPSNTGIENPHEIISKALPNADVEVCYVTRTYLTRHGAGRFDEECNKADINPYMIDKTNVPNPYQGSMRYGKLDVDALCHRIINDFNQAKSNNYKMSLAFTHTNEFDIPAIKEEYLSSMAYIYTSDGETRNSVK